MKTGVLKKFYTRLFESFGPQQWWPGDSPFEIIVGAILTQNTNWGNVEKALNNLKQENLLTPQRLSRISHERLAALIKPAGYFNVKAKRLKNFLDYLFAHYNGDLDAMAGGSGEQLRDELLSINGIGPETADSILLYAFQKPVFVIDAYTHRILYRHGLTGKKADYGLMQELFTKNLSQDITVYNEYHALIVRIGKDYCKPRPACEQCPLRDIRYSLKKRCGKCFRYFKRDEQAVKAEDRLFCKDCV
ncbi:MAG: endonuclease III domain-containing protein [Candidatus Omnitrophota bacterium]